MTKYHLKPLTETTWILTADGSRLGLVSQTKDCIAIVGNIEPKKYADMSALQKRFNNSIIIENFAEAEIDEPASNINGFPVKHSYVFNVLEDPVPNYTRTESSTARYAAGYYGLKFPNGWTQSFCPKLTTLTEYEYVGPFTTKLEMQHQITAKNRLMSSNDLVAME